MLRSRTVVVISMAVQLSVALGCGIRSHPTGTHAIVVHVPPTYDARLTDSQNHRRFQEFLYSARGNLPRASEEVPNDDSLIFIKLDPEGALRINGENLRDAANMTQYLLQVFGQREMNRVFWPGTNSVIKAVGIDIPPKAKYSDLLEVSSAVKESGADPIVLILEGHLPQQKVVRPKYVVRSPDVVRPTKLQR
jgi:biopolymer transport protein ExbD